MSQIKVPPHSIESEQALLSGLLVKPDLIKNLTLANEDFYRESHSLLYTVMAQMEMDL